MADRCIDPLSNYDEGCKTPGKNVFCDTHPLHLSHTFINLICIIGQIHTQSIHALYHWGLTLYNRLTHSPLSGGLTIHSNIRVNKGSMDGAPVKCASPYSWGVCCCGGRVVELSPYISLSYTNATYILHNTTNQ